MLSKIVKLAMELPLEDDLSEAVATAATSLLGGHVIAIPTDTIYGVSGLSQSNSAITTIYDIKRRNLAKPIAICVGDIDDIYRWSKVTVSRQLLDALLPGPVTVVMERSPELNPDLNPGTHLIGIRIPNHDFIRALTRRCGQPLALTSANISSETSPLRICEFESLWPQLDVIVDGGALGDTEKARLGSTVVDLSMPGKFKIIRAGSACENTMRTLKEHGLQESG